MKIYLVGGAVRDKLLNLAVKDKDWVVVGANSDEMLSKGYKQVGKDFPVFLHPDNKEEYALARTERKTAKGYHGFEFDAGATVTLEQDLERRDLTINAIAQADDGELIDPFNGRNDLEQGLLKHVSKAFAEDPVRILRVARFAARYHHLGFKVAHQTNQLMRNMVADKEVDHLVAERVWSETEKAMEEKSPYRYYHVLFACHALAILFPELQEILTKEKATTQHSDNKNSIISPLAILAPLALIDSDPLIRFSVFILSLTNEYHLAEKFSEEFSKKWKCQNEYKELVKSNVRHYHSLTQLKLNNAEAVVEFFYQINAFRNRKLFEQTLYCCNLYHALENNPGAKIEDIKNKIQQQSKALLKLLAHCNEINAQQIQSEDPTIQGRAMGEAIKQKRTTHLQAIIDNEHAE